jgi:hypothetical protein
MGASAVALLSDGKAWMPTDLGTMIAVGRRAGVSDGCDNFISADLFEQTDLGLVFS